MDTRQFFSKLDFDPAEIDDLLDNILLDYPDLILDLLRKSNSGSKISEPNKEFQVGLSEPNKEFQVGLPEGDDITNKTEERKQLDSVSSCGLIPEYSINTHLKEQTSTYAPICIEEDLSVDRSVPIVEINFVPISAENVTFHCVEQINNKPKTTMESSSEINSKIENSEKSKNFENVFIESTKNKIIAKNDIENKDLESTQFLLRELEEELERLTCVVNETSIVPVSTIRHDLSHGSECPSHTSKRNEVRQRNLYLEEPFKKMHAGKERPHSAFEQSSLSGKIIDRPISKYTNNIGEDGNEQERAKCFNLKGTFSLGRYNQKKNKKDGMPMDQKDLQSNTSEHLFKEFRNWQPLYKQASKGGKSRKRMKHLSAHNLRESSADSERSSMMLEELNTVLDKHLEENIYFGDKFKSMPEVWSEKRVPSWCKLHLSRHEAVNYLRDKPVRSFVVRSSNSYKGAYGLVLKITEGHRDARRGGQVDCQVKNYLIETLPAGVRIKGSPNEPIFPDLASLIKEHCRNPISLPCKLLLRDPVEINLDESDVEQDDSPLNLSKDVLDSIETLPQINLNCSVLYLSSEFVESLSETAAVRKATDSLYSSPNQKKTTICQLRISSSGLTVTDACRSLFFRRFYPGCIILYAGINADDQRWAWTDEMTQRTNTSRIFGVVTRKNSSMSENTCHLFAELDHSADEIVANILRLVV